MKWSYVAIKSTEAELKVQRISMAPVHSAVVVGAEFKLSCTATNLDTNDVPAITFHKSGDATELSTVASVTDGASVTGTLTISAATVAMKGMYYCKATWKAGTVDSDTAYLSVLTWNDGADTSVWGVTGKKAVFNCQYDVLVRMSESKPIDSGDKHVTTSVVWKYKAVNGASWTDITSDSRCGVC